MRLKKADIIIFLIPVAIAAISLFMTFGGTSGVSASIYVGGKLVREVALNEDAKIDLKLACHNIIEVKGGKIGFVSADCPDGTCVKTGFIFKSGQVSACVPSGALIKISGEIPELDAVAH